MEFDFYSRDVIKGSHDTGGEMGASVRVEAVAPDRITHKFIFYESYL